MRLKTDETLGNVCAQWLRNQGHDVATVDQEAMNKAQDDQLLEACRDEQRCLVTLEPGFADPLTFDPAKFPGIAVLKLAAPVSAAAIEGLVRTMCAALASSSILGQLWIVEPGRVRQVQVGPSH